MALPVLSLRQHGLLHFYEQRDGGLCHVIRQMSGAEGYRYLDRIAAETGFRRDSTWMGDLPTVSILKDSFTHADAANLKAIFPDIKMVNMPDEAVIYDARTITVDHKSRPPKNPDSYFDERNVLRYDVEREIANMVIRDNDLHYDLINDAEFRAKVTRAIEWFGHGELNADTLPIWWAYFNTERSFIDSADLESPIWQAFFGRVSQELEFALHPGAHRLYPLHRNPDQDPEDNPLTPKAGLVFPSNVNGRIGFVGEMILNNPSPWVFQASVGKRNEQTPDVDPLTVKGCVELGYDAESGISMLAKIEDLPLALKVRMATNVGHSVFENRLIAEKIGAGIDNLMSAINEKRGQDAISEHVLALSRIMSSALSRKNDPNDLTLHTIKARNVSRLKDFGVENEFAQLMAALYARQQRLARIFDRRLLRTESITNIAERKESLENLLVEQLDLREGLGSDVTVEQNRRDKLKNVFADIDNLGDLHDLVLSSSSAFDKQSRPVIIQALASYEEAKAEIAKEKLRQQQEQNRENLKQAALGESPLAPGESASLLEGEHEGNEGGNKKVVHEDVGEKIGGARKDLYTRITSANLDQLNMEEKIKYVKKDRIWPKPDWGQMKEDGLSLFNLHYIKIIRDAIEPQAQKLTRSTYRKSSPSLLAENHEDFAYWLTAVEFVRDKLMSAKEESFLETIKEISEFLDKPVSEAHQKTGSFFDDSTKFGHALGNSYKRKFYLGRELARDYSFAQQYRRNSDPFLMKKLGIKPKGTDDQANDSKDTGEESQTKTKLPYPEHLKTLTRIGEDWRNGKDVTGEDLLNTFGFRGVEYGNWVGNNERQIVLNHAYDAFMDLAYAIGLAPEQFKMISMNGTLALGFGSRGHGKALAHYEPINNVINITKIKGAGSMGHEWFHAFDAYLAKLTGVSTMREKLFSEIVGNHHGHKREQTLASIKDPSVQAMARAVVATVDKAEYKPRNQETIEREIDGLYVRSASHLGSWARGIAFDALKEASDSAKYPAIPTQAIINMLKALNPAELRATSGIEFIGKIAVIMVCEQSENSQMMSDKQKEKLATDLTSRLSNQGREQGRIGLDWLSSQIVRTKESKAPMETDFLQEAKKLDGKSKKYWQTPCELLARSFSVAIFEKLKENGLQSDYLVRGAERREFADGTIYKGNSNPEGEERDVLNACHSEILNAIFEHAQEILPATKPQDELSSAMSM